MIIDAHQHFWNYDAEKHSWIDDSMQIIQRDFTPADLQILYTKNNVDGCVTVQVEQTQEETTGLIEIAKQYSFIKGIVGWADLQSPGINEQLDFFSQFPVVKGFRHIVQAEPADFLYNKNFRNGISFLQQYNFTYDILVYPHQLKAAVNFVSFFPNQRFVLDHIAKPCIKDGLIDEWKKDIAALASYDNVWCKLSGLVTEADWKHHSYNNFIPYLEVAINAFGIDRVMFGSDWPVCLVADSFENVFAMMNEFFKSFSKEEREKVFAWNASQFYNLDIT